METLFLITARGGSKGVPGKNLRRLGGISLVGFKALSALGSRYCNRLIISTDTPEIQEDARAWGAEVPFTRPAELASDTAASVDVVAHAMDWVETHEGRRYDAVMLLEPSSPFARSSDYDAAVEMMSERHADVVVGMRPAVSCVFVGPLDGEGRISSIVRKMAALPSSRRQDLPPEYTMNAALYLSRWDYFKRHRSFYHDPETTYGYVMDPSHSVEIDTLDDLRFAEFLVDKGYVDLAPWRSQAALVEALGKRT